MCNLRMDQICHECGQSPSDNQLWLNGVCSCCLRINHELEEALQQHCDCLHAKLRNIFGQIPREA